MQKKGGKWTTLRAQHVRKAWRQLEQGTFRTEEATLKHMPGAKGSREKSFREKLVGLRPKNTLNDKPQRVNLSCQDGAAHYCSKISPLHINQMLLKCEKKLKTQQDPKVRPTSLWPRNKSKQYQATGCRARSWQRWPGVLFLEVHRPEGPSLKLGLGSGCHHSSWTSVYAELHLCLRSQPTKLTKGREPESLRSVPRLAGLGGHIEPRRKPVDEEGKNREREESNKEFPSTAVLQMKIPKHTRNMNTKRTNKSSQAEMQVREPSQNDLPSEILKVKK